MAAEGIGPTFAPTSDPITCRGDVGVHGVRQQQPHGAILDSGHISHGRSRDRFCPSVPLETITRREHGRCHPHRHIEHKQLHESLSVTRSQELLQFQRGLPRRGPEVVEEPVVLGMPRGDRLFGVKRDQSSSFGKVDGTNHLGSAISGEFLVIRLV